jgi:transcription initiation factor TFIID subunit TAF12
MTFQALYTLTDLRAILRQTAPQHEMDDTQRVEAQRLLENLERQVASLKQEMLK